MISFLRRSLWALPLVLAPMLVFAAPGIPAVTIETAPGGGQTYTLTLQLLALMTAITFLPAILLMMTAFTRIVNHSPSFVSSFEALPVGLPGFHNQPVNASCELQICASYPRGNPSGSSVGGLARK